MSLPRGSHIDSYEVLDLLGQGAFGLTYAVRDRALDLRFALKEYFPKELARRSAAGMVEPVPGQEPAFDEGLQRFLDEGRTLARLDHPNLARVLRHFTGQGTAYLLMPHYAGRTLHDLLLSDGTFKPAEIDALIAPLLDALEYLQHKRVVHSDIKPSNILVSPGGEPLLLDFGAARVLGPEQVAGRALAGSAGYAAPEQLDPTLGPGPRTDIYGLAATVYRLITGQIPVPAQDRNSAGAPEGGSDTLPALAGQPGLGEFRDGFLSAVDQGLALDPAQRPRTIAHWRKSLGSAAGRDSTAVATDDRSERVLLPQLLGGLVLLALISLALWMFLPGSKPDESPAEAPVSNLPDTSLAGDDASWEQAVRTDTAAGFRAYLQAFPRGKHSVAAREQLAGFDLQRWESVRDSTQLDDFQAYLDDFPDGRFVVEAQARAAVLQDAEERASAERAARDREDSAAFKAALAAQSLTALDDYLAAFPGGLHVAEALQRKAELQRASRDEQAWASATALDRKSGYEAYLKAHPDGLHLGAALAAIDRLTLDPGKVFRDCATCPEMIVVPPGRFMQGAAADDSLARSNERPVRQVRLAEAFAIGLREVSFAEWDQCVTAGACRAQGVDNGWGRASRPVILVNWVDAQAYVSWLSETTGAVYRLPSESQWEYVARAGEQGPWAGGDAAGLCRAANVAGTESGFDWRHEACGDPFSVGTAPGGYFVPNALGVYDMVGNVAEWTADCMNLSYLDAPADGSPWERGLCSSRVTRGGSWFSGSQELRLSSRFPLRNGERNDFTGFRVVREVRE